MENRPNGITVVGSVAIGAGMLSACCNVYGMVTTAATLAMGGRFGGIATDPEASRLITMQREMAIYTGIPAVLGIFVALFLVAGGGLVLSMKPIGRPMLVGALAAAIFVALTETALSAVMSYRMSGMMGGPPDGAGGLGGAGGMVVAAGIGIAALWLVLKLAVYGPCLVYMLRGETATFFAGVQRVGARGD